LRAQPGPLACGDFLSGQNDELEDYAETAKRLFEFVVEQPGFAGIESAVLFN
jgi:hypothetical protein